MSEKEEGVRTSGEGEEPLWVGLPDFVGGQTRVPRLGWSLVIYQFRLGIMTIDAPTKFGLSKLSAHPGGEAIERMIINVHEY